MAVKWTEEQKRVIETRGRNILVSAAAGSGKTAVLVARILSRICDREDPANIDELLIVTFTKAAANEFYERFRDRLDEEAKNGDEQAAKALKDIDLCFMGTIDAFCHMVLSEHPVTAGIPVLLFTPTGIPRPLSDTLIMSPGSITTSIFEQ